MRDWRRAVRRLSAEEEQLWARVTATIRPLSRDPVKSAEPAAAPIPTAPRPVAALKGRVPPIRPAVSAPPPRTVVGAGGLDSHWDRRLKSGSVTPDRVIDLHGHNLDAAWNAIDRGLEAAIRAGDRLVLLITGHERPGEPPVQRGKIRAAVHDWLAFSRHNGHIASVRGAHRKHGGGGSLYLILRR